jgi:thioredoxin reductase (NADPH)
MESTISAFHGGVNLESVDIRNLKTGATRSFKTDGAFIFIGYLPNTDFLKGKVGLNQRGEITVGKDMSTSVKGVFAAGDCIDKPYRQVTTAVGDGTVAALAVLHYVNDLKVADKKLITI